MKSIAQLKRRIETLERIMAREKPVWSAAQVTPGPFETGRSNYTLGKRLDAENARKAKAFTRYEEARKECDHLTQLLEDVESGERHTNGQRRADAPSRTKAAQDRHEVNELLAAYYKRVLKPGDEAASIYGARFTIKRINAKSITSTDVWAGEPVKYDLIEVVPVEDGQALTPAQVAARIKSLASD